MILIGKAFCKKTLISNSFGNIKILYKKNHWYNIYKNYYVIDNNVIFINDEFNLGLSFVYDKDKSYIGNWGEFKDFFITEQQYRKLKLQKINETR